MKLKRILVPIDFSDESLRALDYAVELAQPFGATLTVLFALERIQFVEMGHVYGAPVSPLKLIEEQRRSARAELAQLAERLASARATEVRTLLREGTPHRVIVDAAKRPGADLIVMGTHGRTGMSRLLLGSVTELVIRHAHCPVLTVRGGKRPRTTRPKAPRTRPVRG
jgi:nucleotide-binding universal stress UspA family protein